MPSQGIALDAVTAPPPLPEALEAARRAEAEAWRDPSVLLEDCRQALAGLLGAPSESVLFTSGGTEADNFAVKGLCAAAPPGRRHLLVSAVEPLAVEHPARTLERQGWTLGRIPVDPLGRVGAGALEACLRSDTALVSVILAQPSIGTWQDLPPLARLTHARGALFHTDASWALPFAPLDFQALGVDALSLSGLRLSGVAGAGALILKSGTPIRPLIEGGIQEGGLRAGTPALGPIAALAAAAARLRREGPGRSERLGRIGNRLARELSRLGGLRLTGDPGRRIPGHASACFESLDGEALATALDAEGIRISSGSPCATGTGKVDPALLAIGIPQGLARGSVILSAWDSTTDEEVEKAVRALARAAGRLRSLAPAAEASG